MKFMQLNKFRSSLIINSIFLVLFSSSQVKAQPYLYGIATNLTDLSKDSLVSIDALSGQATTVFDFTAPKGLMSYYLALDPVNGHFYTSLYRGTSYYRDSSYAGLMDLDPHTQSASFLAPSFAYAEGIEYLPQAGGLVVATSTGSTHTRTLTHISEAGTVINSWSIPTEDSDTLGIDPITGDLLTFDANNPTNGFSLNRIVDVAGSATRIGLYNGPVDSSITCDLASADKVLYLSALTSLYRFNDQLNSNVLVGSFGLNGRVVTGIAAAVPEPRPGFVIIVSAGVGALLRRRKKTA